MQNDGQGRNEGSAKRLKSVPISKFVTLSSWGRRNGILARPTNALPSLFVLDEESEASLQRVVNQ